MVEANGVHVLHELGRVYPELSPSQRKVADFVIHHNDHAAFMTLTELAEATGVSKSTVERVARESLGFPSYLDFRTELQEVLRKAFHPAERIRAASGEQLRPAEALAMVVQEDVANLQATMQYIAEETFDQVVEQLFQAERVFLMARGSAHAMAELLTLRLRMVRPNVDLISADEGSAKRRLIWLSERDLVLAISFPRYSSQVIDDAAYARERGATVIGLTDRLSSPLVAVADLALTVATSRSTLVSSLTAACSLVDALVVAMIHAKPEVVERINNLSDRDIQFLETDRSQFGARPTPPRGSR